MAESSEQELSGEIDVWECYMYLLPVFGLCQCSVISGMATAYMGFSAQEIKSALELSCVDRSDWPDASDALHSMGESVGVWYNERIRKK